MKRLPMSYFETGRYSTCVYVIKADRFYKIGFSIDVNKRIHAIQNGSPFKCILLLTSIEKPIL